MEGEVIKSFLVGLGFGVDEASLSKFTKAIAGATIKVTALYASIQVAAAGIFKSITSISEGFEQMGYEYRIISPMINKTLMMRNALLAAYKAAGINIANTVRQSLLFNMSLAKTKFVLEAIYKSVGAKFFPILTKQMDIFRSKIYANMPKIQAALTSFVNFVFKAFDATIRLGTRIWEILGRVYDFLTMLDTATNGWSTKILLAVAAWKFLNLAFLATPLGMLLTGFVALLALWDDFKTFKEGGEALIDWGSRTTKIIVGVTAAVTGLAAAIGTIIGVMRAYAAVQWVVNAAMAANPIGIAIIAITVLIGLLTALAVKMGYLKGVGDFFSGLGEKTMNLFGGNNAQANMNNVAQPQPLVPQGNVSHQKVSQETNVLVQGSADAQATGKAVAAEQGKVNFDLTQNLKRATR